MTSLFEVSTVFYVYGPLLLLLSISYFVLPYLFDSHHLRRNCIGGPKSAAFSNLWLAYVAARGDRSESVHRLHQEYGKIIRIAPNHISIADPKAIEPIYGHGSGMFKSDFYDAFVSIRASLFTTRDRAAHARKRKVVSSVLSQQNVLQFEPLIRKHVRLLLAQWDLKCAKGFSFLAFGVTADLTFGASFGMIEAQRDIAPMLQLSESNT
ncbi:cytochrome P450 family protein [Ceratobasidium sp. AG-Ba]|nr:cytochrome P450 family protein [Ceratobasidium sp. AG-Ba]